MCHLPDSQGSSEEEKHMNSQVLPKTNSQKRADVKHRFLLVDDHELVRFGLAQLIDPVPGWEVCGEASDVQSAINIARDTNPTFAIVDLSLKDSNGLELIKQLNASFPEMKILVFSMHEEALYAERTLRAGAHGYVHKQQPARNMMAALRKILEGKTYLSSEQTQRLLSRATGRGGAVETAPVESLSDRELQVFELIGQGNSVKQIAKELHVSSKTVEYHRDHIKEKLGVRNSAEVTRRATIWSLERD